jgi:putative redox protein
MECTVSWTGATGAKSNMGFVAETGSGHILMMDGAPDAAKPEMGGQNMAPRPMETLLAGTGGCTAYDVVLILKRGRHQVQGCSVKLTSERAETDPKVFTKIHMHFTVTGKGIPAQALERAIAMSHDKYNHLCLSMFSYPLSLKIILKSTMRLACIRLPAN